MAFTSPLLILNITTRLLMSRGTSSLDSLPDFQFETIHDGLPPSDADSTQDNMTLCYSTSTTCFDLGNESSISFQE
jgi:hypothetical protein